MKALTFPCRALVLLSFLGMSSGLAALDLTFDVDFPKFTGFDATIDINGQSCPIVVRVAPDAKGKYACIPGGCTVNGVPVIAKAALKRALDAQGNKLYFYSASLKSAPEATEKVALKVTGELTSGVADFNYSGPKGKASLSGHPIDILAELDLRIGTVSISPDLLDPTKPGKLGGTGSITTGLGNDMSGTGPLKINMTPTTLTMTLKVGTRKVQFKAVLEGNNWVGTLKVLARPLALTTPYSVPATGMLAPPTLPSGGGKCSESIDDAQQGQSLFRLTMFNENFSAVGGLDLKLTPAGNHFAFASMPTVYGHYSGEKNCLAIDVEPQSPGPWFCMKVAHYDFSTGQSHGSGTLCFTLEEVAPVPKGRFRIDATDGVITGTFYSSEPVCGGAVGEPFVNAQLTDQGGAPLGTFQLVQTEKGKTSMYSLFNAAQKSYVAQNPCLDVDPSPSSVGPWFCAPLGRTEPFSPEPVPFGEICFNLTSTSPFLEGTFSARDGSGNEVVAGKWKNTIPVCGEPDSSRLIQGNIFQGAEFPIGSFQLMPTKGGKVFASLSAFFNLTAYEAIDHCLDANLDISTPGTWFTSTLSRIDPLTGHMIPAGSMRFDVDTFSPTRAGNWTARDLGGAELGSGKWEELAPQGP